MSPVVSVLAAAGLLVSGSAAPAAATPLEAFLDNARPVMVFASDPTSARATNQIARLKKASAALSEREMPVLVIGSTHVVTLAGCRAPENLDAARLRKAYGVAKGSFAVVLVGKDGGEKFRSVEPVDVARLTDLVDLMPMRRREVRQGTGFQPRPPTSQ